MSCLNITQHFDKYFQLIVANTAELKQEVFSIRYQVYCEELNFEPAENFPNGLEKDIYDERSIHYLLQHRPKIYFTQSLKFIV
ncbi:MAG: GNAT family N-acyltransferase [Xenococcaceae cyanobacterium]